LLTVWNGRCRVELDAELEVLLDNALDENVE
jgi:hypothetical protein